MTSRADEVKISYAQNGEDVRAWRALRHLESPTYVEVGAHDPFDMSVSAALSALGWSGLLLEADPEMAEKLRSARPRDIVVGAAAYDSGGLLFLHQKEKVGQAFVSGTDDVRDGTTGSAVSVPAVRVDEVLDRSGLAEVHFMTVDVEGAEAAVLRGCDFSRWRPWILCIEATMPDSRTPTHEAWEPELLGSGYLYVASDGLNRWYVAQEHDELARVLSEPFNVLDEGIDGWRRASLVASEESNRQLDDQLQQALSTANAMTLERDRAILGRDHAILGRDQAKLERDQALGDSAQLHRDLELIVTSHSWRLTAPLRAARGLALPSSGRNVGSSALGLVNGGSSRFPDMHHRAVAVLDRHPGIAALARRVLARKRAAERSPHVDFDAVGARRETALQSLALRARQRRGL